MLDFISTQLSAIHTSATHFLHTSSPLQSDYEPTETQKYLEICRAFNDITLSNIPGLILNKHTVNSRNLGGIDETYNVTPLIYAVIRKTKSSFDEKCISKFTDILKAGAEVNATDNDGFTALMHAVRTNNTLAQKILLGHKADPELPLQFYNGKLEYGYLRMHYGDLYANYYPHLVKLLEKNVHRDLAVLITEFCDEFKYPRYMVIDYFDLSKSLLISKPPYGKIKPISDKSKNEMDLYLKNKI